MLNDIENRDDLYQIVKIFYSKLMDDDLMCHFFENFKNPTHLEEHLQILVNFWDNILFYSGTYQKNAMKPHLDMQKENSFKSIHFERWLHHFNTSVNQLFKGENAHAIKSRALSIATVMKIKILNS